MKSLPVAPRRFDLFTSPLPLLAACLLLAGLLHAPGVLAQPAGDSDWNRFRGPDVVGVSRATGVFDELGEVGLRQVWKKALGGGYSGIAIAGNRAVTLYADGPSDWAASFDTGNGRQMWTYKIGPTYEGHDGSHGGPISTPLVDGRRIFGLGAWGKLFAVDLESGREIWSTHLVDDHGVAKPEYGFGASPILEEGVLVVLLGGEDKAVGGFDPDSGELLWSAGSDTASYQSPVPLEFEGRRQVVAATDEQLFGLEASSGKVLWQFTHGGGGARGAHSMVPVPAGEGRLFLAHQNDASMMVRLRRDNGAVGVEKLWEGRAIRNSFNVPVYHEGHLYAYSSRFLTCVDAATGESRWRSRQPGDGFLILVDGRLVIVTKEGGVHVAEATPEGYVEITGRPVFIDHSWSFPSFAKGSIFVRSMGEIARLNLAAGVTHSDVQVAGLGLVDSAFDRFLGEVDAAGEVDKSAVVDRFLKAQTSFPIVEGENRVHFVYRGPAADVALAGDMFGARQEKPMTRVPGTGLFYLTLELEPDARLSYLFIVDYERSLDPRNPRTTTTTLLGEDMEITFGRGEMEMSWMAMPKWRAPAHLAEAPEASRGRLESHAIDSEAVGRKITLDVYLPRDYDEGELRYPVAYLHDGAAARERGRIPNSLDHLIGTSVAPVIAVFVTIPARGPGYARALVEEVVPLIDGRYRTRPVPEARANVGTTFSAFQSLVLTLSRRDVFGKVGMQSMALFTQMEPMLRPLLETVGERPPEIYMDWGKYDMRNPHEAWDMAAVNRELAQELRSKGVRIAGGEVNDGAGWASWRNRTDRMFEALFPLPE